MSDTTYTDRFDAMTKADLSLFLAERNHEHRVAATKAELQLLCRIAATRGKLRRTPDDHRRALDTLRGVGFAYSQAEAVKVIAELIADAHQLAEALGFAQEQLRPLHQPGDEGVGR